MISLKEGYKDTEIGVIPVEWQSIELGDIATFARGKGISKKDISENGVECIRYGELFTTYNEVIRTVKSKTNSTTNMMYSKVNDTLMPTSDVTPTGLATASALNKEGVILGGDILIIRSNDILNSYLSYFIRSHKKQIMKLVSGSTVYHIYANDMKKLKIPLPPLKEQEKIADILTTADDKIDAIALQLDKAETLKKGLLQKLLSEGINHCEFKDSELGKIPESWEVGKLEDILTIKYGKSQKDVEDINGDYPILGTGGIMGYANNYLCNKASVLIGRKGTIDKPQYMEIPFWTVDTLFYTELKKDIHPKFVYYIFQTIPWKKYNEASGVPSLSKPNIHNIATVLLTFEEQLQIADILSTADEKLEVLRAKKEMYETLKKGLLQKLLSGEVRV